MAPILADENYSCRKCSTNFRYQYHLMLHTRYFCSSSMHNRMLKTRQLEQTGEPINLTNDFVAAAAAETHKSRLHVDIASSVTSVDSSLAPDCSWREPTTPHSFSRQHIPVAAAVVVVFLIDFRGRRSTRGRVAPPVADHTYNDESVAS